MSVRAIRGAIQVSENTPEAIAEGTRELVGEIFSANNVKPESIISVIFTATQDLNASFPAAAARDMGLSDTPLICSVEIAVPGSLPRVIRAMVTVESELEKGKISHIYLGGAKALRTDIAQ